MWLEFLHLTGVVGTHLHQCNRLFRRLQLNHLTVRFERCHHLIMERLVVGLHDCRFVLVRSSRFSRLVLCGIFGSRSRVFLSFYFAIQLLFLLLLFTFLRLLFLSSISSSRFLLLLLLLLPFPHSFRLGTFGGTNRLSFRWAGQIQKVLVRHAKHVGIFVLGTHY